MKNAVGQAFSVIGLAAHLGRGLRRVTADAVVGDRLGLPRAVEDIDASVLSRVMGTTVRSVRVLSSDAGTSSRARLVLTGKDVPESVFVKIAAQTAATRLMGELGRLGHTEVRFYSQLAPQLTGVPEAYGAAFDPWTGRYLLVLEDLPAESCEFPDTLHPLSPDQASLIVELLADLHASFWDRLPRDGRGPLGWLYTPSGDVTSLLTGSLMHTSIKRLAERTTIPVENGRFIADNYRAVAALIDTPPHTVMHGDAHPGNMYFHGGKAGLLDWQAVRRGHPSRELAYTLITSLTPEDRRADSARSTRRLPARTRGRRRTRPGSRRSVAAVPPGRAVRICRPPDHRWDGGNAGRKHRHGRPAARCRSARRPGNHRGAEEFPVAAPKFG